MDNRVLALVVLLPLAACAGPGTTASLTDVSNSGSTALASDADDDKSCKKLTGLMQVRLLQVRDYDERHKSSITSRALQYAESSTLGGSSRGIDTDSEHAADLAALKSYNEQLAAKGCKSFDLAKELQARGPHDSPAASVPPPKLPAVAGGETN